MKVDGKTLEFDKTLWVKYGGVDVEERGANLAVTGMEEDAYLKVLNHFGRVLRLYTFEGDQWVDAETGLPAIGGDDSGAGHLAHPATVPSKGKTAKAPPKSGKKPALKSAVKSPVKSTKSAAKTVSKAGSKNKTSRAKATQKDAAKTTTKTVVKTAAKTGVKTASKAKKAAKGAKGG